VLMCSGLVTHIDRARGRIRMCLSGTGRTGTWRIVAGQRWPSPPVMAAKAQSNHCGPQRGGDSRRGPSPGRRHHRRGRIPTAAGIRSRRSAHHERVEGQSTTACNWSTATRRTLAMTREQSSPAPRPRCSTRRRGWYRRRDSMGAAISWHTLTARTASSTVFGTTTRLAVVGGVGRVGGSAAGVEPDLTPNRAMLETCGSAGEGRT
jgi:hypothetical protein